MRLERLDLPALQPAQARHAVGRSSPEQLPQAGHLCLPRSHDDLPTGLMGNVMLGAVTVKLARSLHAQTRLQRPRRVVEAGVNHARVVTRLMRSELRLALEQAHRQASVASAQLAREREAENAAAD